MNDLVGHIRREGPILSVGLLAADLLRLGAQLDELAAADVRFVHFDVMDGVFCPGLSAGPPLIAAVPSTFVKDVHLLIDEPQPKLEDYLAAGADILTIHLEAARQPQRCLRSLRGTGVVRGIALNPGTALAAVEPLLDEVDFILLLAVNPGWAGQTFAPATADRLRTLVELTQGRILLGVDGGITAETLAVVADLGPDVVVSGSAVFAGELGENARRFKSILASGARTATRVP